MVVAPRPELAGHPDRVRWNTRYAERDAPAFTPHPLASQALDLPLPPGPVLDLACGPSGSALLAAASGRLVTAVDISEVALDWLGAEAARRGLSGLITLVHADLTVWRPTEPCALVLATGFWDRPAFTAAAAAVSAGGLLAWEAFATEARQHRPSLPAAWCLSAGEPACLLPPSYQLLTPTTPAPPHKRQLLARRTHPPDPPPR